MKTGSKHTPETIQRMRLAKLGKKRGPLSTQWKKNIAKAHKASNKYHWTNLWKKAQRQWDGFFSISEVRHFAGVTAHILFRTGAVAKPTHPYPGFKGKCYTLEEVLRIERDVAKWKSEKGQRMSSAIKGIKHGPHSDEHKRKIREGVRRWLANNPPKPKPKTQRKKKKKQSNKINRQWNGFYSASEVTDLISTALPYHIEKGWVPPPTHSYPGYRNRFYTLEEVLMIAGHFKVWNNRERKIKKKPIGRKALAKQRREEREEKENQWAEFGRFNSK